MKTRIAVLAVTLALPVLARAQTAAMSPRAAAVAAETVDEVVRSVGREWPADLLRFRGVPEPSEAGYRALTARGEAFFMRREITLKLDEAAAVLRGRERLLEQSRALAAAAGMELSIEQEQRLLAKLEDARSHHEYLSAREEVLRLLMLRMGWAEVRADGFRMSAQPGRDYIEIALSPLP